MSNARAVRVLRGFVVAGLSTFVAAFSHLVGGGAFPHPMLIVAGLLFSGIFCAALSAGRASWARIIPSVLVAQTGFHLLFSSTGSSGSVIVGAANTGHGMHHAVTTAVDGHVMLPGDTMIAAHLAAAAVTIVALRFGDAALCGLLDSARLIIATLLRLPRIVVEAAPAQATPSSRKVIFPRCPEFLVCIDHRGPPARVAPALR